MEKNKFECEGCGRTLERNDVDETWKSSMGRDLCGSCIWISLDVLNDVYDAKTLNEAKAIIEDFDDEFDEPFLKNRVVK